MYCKFFREHIVLDDDLKHLLNQDNLSVRGLLYRYEWIAAVNDVNVCSSMFL